MYIDTYMNNSDNNAMYKDLTAVEAGVPVLLKENTTLESPVLKIRYRMDGSTPPVPQKFNYCYISEFDRYYFVTNSTYAQQYLEVALQVDALSSFASSLEDVKVLVTRSTNRYDMYLPDPDTPVRADKLIGAKQFYNGFGGESMILAVTGGYVSP